MLCIRVCIEWAAESLLCLRLRSWSSLSGCLFYTDTNKLFHFPEETHQNNIVGTGAGAGEISIQVSQCNIFRHGIQDALHIHIGFCDSDQFSIRGDLCCFDLFTLTLIELDGNVALMNP